MRASVLALLLLGAGASGSVGCAGAEVEYVPRTAEVHVPVDPSEVEVYTDGKPDWEYEMVGYFQEQSADGVPGGRRGLAVLLREMGAERGCDAVILGGNVSRFNGEYRYRSARSIWSWRRRDRRRSESEWVPVFESFGTNAVCAVRVERAEASTHPQITQWPAGGPLWPRDVAP